ncbi:MAG: ABC transporter ATP-binding protein, partial [Gammaproteobacteria bacterium]|nr:ABC transporter ATP-binding protein [Gammaproteobacteria bacterium]NIR96762.1 ABC transporter ATP-binding protein [Gammaproteobacteria bacterium]NIT62467.1 ABC transporter ATP-binding protein [Gammaproteobacteria bacterium]NIV19402.1 ATP-binding cassette domain-containing protein [Gammaproteobacteria bacterium]NIX10490.1 ATP-binding cassette domain-containing protein [Gammaproteobacteria bacterium]
MGERPVIELAGIHRIFPVGDQRVHALNDVNLDVARGEYVSIMGPSGSGKSTLLHIIGLLDRPTAGTYHLDGGDVTALDDERQSDTRRDKIGFVFQFFHLLPRLTAAENVELPMVLAGLPPAERAGRVQQVLEALDLGDRAHHRPEQLSGGQRQRVAIARATVMEPAVLLADEPTGNLDRSSGHEVVELLERLNGRGITLLVVTHDPQIGDRARRCVHMVDGRII